MNNAPPKLRIVPPAPGAAPTGEQVALTPLAAGSAAALEAPKTGRDPLVEAELEAIRQARARFEAEAHARMAAEARARAEGHARAVADRLVEVEAEAARRAGENRTKLFMAFRV